MAKDLAEATATENGAIKAFNELMAAKEAEVSATVEQLVRSGGYNSVWNTDALSVCDRHGCFRVWMLEVESEQFAM